MISSLGDRLGRSPELLERLSSWLKNWGLASRILRKVAKARDAEQNEAEGDVS